MLCSQRLLLNVFFISFLQVKLHTFYRLWYGAVLACNLLQSALLGAVVHGLNELRRGGWVCFSILPDNWRHICLLVGMFVVLHSDICTSVDLAVHFYLQS